MSDRDEATRVAQAVALYTLSTEWLNDVRAIGTIERAIVAAEARGRDAGLMEAAKIVSDLSTKEHQARNDLAFYALNRAWHALNALTPTPSGAGDKGGGDNGQR